MKTKSIKTSKYSKYFMTTESCSSSSFFLLLLTFPFSPYTLFWPLLYQEQTVEDIVIASKYLKAAPKKEISHSPGQGWTRQEIMALNCSKRDSSEI